MGADVHTGVQIGEAVMGIVVPAGPFGGYCESVVLPAESGVRVPAGASFAEAASLPMNGLTARLALDMLALPAGSTLAVTGAAGAFGGYVIGLGKADGLRVMADAAAADEDLITSLGADIVVPRGDEVATDFLRHAPGGVDGLADGAVLNDLIYPAVRDGGGFASVRPDLPRSHPPRGITLHQVGVDQYALSHTALDRLRDQAEAGVVSLRIAGSYRPDNAAEAHRRLEAGGV